MNEIKKNNETNNNNITIKKEQYKEKDKQYVNGENVYVYSVWKNKFTQITLRESTIYKIKNLVCFMLGIVFFILFYIKPNNFKEFRSAITIVLKNVFYAFISLTPFAQPNFQNNNKYHYLIILSCIFFILSTIFVTWALVETMMTTKHKKFFYILFLISFFLIGMNIEYKTFSSLIKISIMFKFLSFILVIGITIVIYSIIFFIISFIAVGIIEEYILNI